MMQTQNIVSTYPVWALSNLEVTKSGQAVIDMLPHFKTISRGDKAKVASKALFIWTFSSNEVTDSQKP